MLIRRFIVKAVVIINLFVGERMKMNFCLFTKEGCRKKIKFFWAGLVTCLLVSFMVVPAMADTVSAVGYVSTVHGSDAFTISDDGSQVDFKPQLDTDYFWNKGSDGSQKGVSDGMKTYAATDVAYGATLSSLAISFDYYSGADTSYSGTPGINLLITNGHGNYAIWSANSGGTGWTTSNDDGDDWTTLTLDFTDVNKNDGNDIEWTDSSTYGAIYESSDTGVLLDGKINRTSVTWADIKDWTVAGFYDKMNYPDEGWSAWGEELWGEVNQAGTDGTGAAYDIVNKYGLLLFWGDSAGSTPGDGDENSDPTRPQGQYSKLIKDLEVVVSGGDTYDITFEADSVSNVPEPATLALLGFGLLSFVGITRRKSDR